MKPSLFVRRKKLNGGQSLGPLVVPGSLLGLVAALCFSISAPLELGLAVLPTDPHRFAPARRVLDQPDDRGVATVNAPAALDRPTA